MKHSQFLPAALVPILVIQPCGFPLASQHGLSSDPFGPRWTQEYSYSFCLAKQKTIKRKQMNKPNTF